jgi:hypothetical protein
LQLGAGLGKVESSNGGGTGLLRPRGAGCVGDVQKGLNASPLSKSPVRKVLV